MKPEPTNKESVKYLQILGVDTRFVSIVGKRIFINNQRFSRFSNKRQETFKRKFPNYSIKDQKFSREYVPGLQGSLQMY